MTWTKICGTTNLEDALMSVEAGADALGFVFYEKSPRNVSVEQVREIVRELPEGVEKVGVFVNESWERVEEIADTAGLTAIQLHGDEYRDPCTPETERNIYLAIPAGDLTGNFVLAPPRNLAAVIVDSGTRQHPGGTGKPFDWTASRAAVAALRRAVRVVIAGGLVVENVGRAISVLQPWGVDAVSGVERIAGRKDPTKVRKFIAAVRAAEQKQ